MWEKNGFVTTASAVASPPTLSLSFFQHSSLQAEAPSLFSPAAAHYASAAAAFARAAGSHGTVAGKKGDADTRNVTYLMPWARLAYSESLCAWRASRFRLISKGEREACGTVSRAESNGRKEGERESGRD